jgi:hypothetical protein
VGTLQVVKEEGGNNFGSFSCRDVAVTSQGRACHLWLIADPSSCIRIDLITIFRKTHRLEWIVYILSYSGSSSANFASDRPYLRHGVVCHLKMPFGDLGRLPSFSSGSTVAAICPSATPTVDECKAQDTGQRKDAKRGTIFSYLAEICTSLRHCQQGSHLVQKVVHASLASSSMRLSVRKW